MSLNLALSIGIVKCQGADIMLNLRDGIVVLLFAGYELPTIRQCVRLAFGMTQFM